MLKLASGKISEVFGAEFQAQDDYTVQVRLPEPPLLLCQRVLAIDAVQKSLGTGTIWTEHTVTADAWYLHHGRMPTGVFIECGQADLTLISYLGIDFHNRGERAYRLLGCEVTWLGEMPQVGDTLKYEIRITGHAQQGAVRLFFFEYEGWVNGAVRVQVRHGQAGFFTRQELREAKGVVWQPLAQHFTPQPRLLPAPCVTHKRNFERAELEAFTRGELWTCFGEEFNFAKTHHRSPTTEGGLLNFLHRVHFDPQGGPVGRGYLRAVQQVDNERCFLNGHFHNDPCMPGTLMANGCQQMVAFFLTALGFTLNKDAWRFAPLPQHTVKFLCRGEVTPQSRELVYEVFVDEIVAEDNGAISLYAHVLCSVDGLKAMLAARSAVSLSPGWPADTLPASTWDIEDSRPLAHIGDFPLDYKSLMHCAQGRSSQAFGAGFTHYEGAVPSPRLPSPPYHFATRVTRLDAQIGTPTVGSSVEMLYDVPADAWYFEDNGVMPFAVLMEVALQPCGWLATANIDVSERPLPHLLFRNLDGKGLVHRAVTPQDHTLRTCVKLTAHAKLGANIIVKFDVQCFCGDEMIFYLETAFGFFPPSAFAAQKGLDVLDEERAVLDAPDNFALDLCEQPSPYVGTGKLPASKLLMLDRVNGYWPQGGKVGLGQWRADKSVDPGDWYFKAHFFSDPVQPGSLGVEALVQLIQLHMLHHKLHHGMDNPRFEPCLPDRDTEWHYRGQVVPSDDKVVFDIEILEQRKTEDGYLVEAEGRLWLNGLKIYHVPHIGMCLRETNPTLHELQIKPFQLGSVRFQRATETEHLQGYIDLLKAVIMEEYHESHYPLPTPDSLRDVLVMVGIQNDQVVCGLSITPPREQNFDCFTHMISEHLPD